MGRAHEKSSQPMPLFLMQKNQITCIKNEVMVILLIEKVIDNKMFPKSTAGLYISDSYQRNFISHRHRIFYGLLLYNALCKHRFRNLLKAGDVGAHYVVAFRSVPLCRFVDVVVDVDHDLL